MAFTVTYHGVSAGGLRGTFTFPAGAEALSVMLDPGTWLVYEARPFARAQ